MTVEDIALTMTPGVGVKGAMHLLEVFGDAPRIFAASEADLTGFAGLRPDVARQVVRKVGFGDAEREVKFCARHNIHALASTDEEYPSLLRETPDYPHVLYVQGAVEALSGRCISMVGTRKATSYGLRMCNDLVSGLAERVPGVCIVSGLAFGIDAACHRAALTAGVKTVAVLPSSLPDVTPTQHRAIADEILRSGGALVSELHSQMKQRGTFYLARNRIIAGLSGGMVVVESPCGGGSLMTAHCADGYSRSVMAVPGRAVDGASQGTNRLIRNKKAQLILSADDIVEELMWDLNLSDVCGRAKREAVELTADESRLLACFPSSDPVSMERLGELIGLPAGELSFLLLGLEMTGAVRQVPGNMYVKLI